jgi:ubiquinone/menaquinone biosynthesis C-methylase UbiE
MMVDLVKLDPAVRAKYLGKPEGEIGRALADSMAERNWPVYEAAIGRVGLQPGERLLEIGFGNGKLVPRLLTLAPGSTYTGVDFSETMVAEAVAFNRNLIEAAQATFHLASVDEMPLADASFDRAVTVNTIYFWPDPVHALAEIRRVLRPDGAFVVVAHTPEDAAKAPHTRYGFRNYSEAQLIELHEQAGFGRIEVEVYRDSAPTLDRSGIVQREVYFVVSTA